MNWICPLGRKVKAVTDVEIHGQIAQQQRSDDDDDDDDYAYAYAYDDDDHNQRKHRNTPFIAWSLDHHQVLLPNNISKRTGTF